MVVAGEMVSVVRAAEMESITISAIQFMIKMITTSASRNLGMIVGAEPLRDILISFRIKHRFHYLKCYMSDLIMPNGCRKFVNSIHKSMKKYNHFYNRNHSLIK